MPNYNPGAWSPAAGSQGVNANLRNQGLGAMQGAQTAGVDYERARRQQEMGLGMYQDAAMGQGPSQAQALMQQLGDQNMANQMQAASMGQSGDIAGQARAAQAAGMAAQNQTQNNLGAMAAQEQQAGMAGYAGLGTQMAGQAQQMQQAQMQQQQNLMGLQVGYDQHLRQQELASKQAQTQRNLGWTQFGVDTGMGVLEGAFGGIG